MRWGTCSPTFLFFLFAAIIAGGVVGLALAASLLTIMVYNMKKKDEGGYTVNQKNTSKGGYQKPKTKEEFIA